MSMILGLIKTVVVGVFLCSGMLLEKIEEAEMKSLNTEVIRGEIISIDEFKIEDRVLQLEEIIEELQYNLEALKDRLNNIEYTEQ